MSRPFGVTIRVREEGSGAICADVLAALPEWFGFPDSVAAYVEAAEMNPTVVTSVAGRDCGILTLRIHTPYAAEIVVMGVLPEHHRAGIGLAMLEAAESWLAERDVGYLQVKTLSPVIPTRDMRPPGPSTSAVGSGPWRRCQSCGERNSRRSR